GIALVAQGQAAMGAGAYPGIVAAPPVGQVVAALRPGPGMVGDLIGRQPGFGEARLGDLVEPGRSLLRREGETAAPPGAGEGCVLPDGQLIDREMLPGEAEGALQLGRPIGLRLAGAGIDQIEAEAREMPAGEIESRQCLLGAVFAAEEAKGRI